MKKIRFLVIFLLFSNVITAQSVEEILQKFVDSSGGYERLSTINSIHFEMRSISSNDTTFITIDKEKPNRYATTYQLPGKKVGFIFNNGKCAYVSNGKTKEINDIVTLEELWVQSNILPEMNYDLSKYTIDSDTATMHGVLYNTLSIYSPTNRFLTINYYHPKTGLLDIVADNYGRVCYYTNYRYFKGFRLPRKAIVIQPDGQEINLEIMNIKLDLPNNPSLFNL